MNKIFKVIWSKSKQCYIVVSEIAKNKTGKKKIVVASILAILAMAGTVNSVEAAIPEGTTSDPLGIAMGALSKSGSNQSIAIGYLSEAKGTNAASGGGNPGTAVGAGAKSIGAGTSAYGLSAYATADYATAIGKSANAAAINSIAIGKDASITAPTAGTTFGGQDSIAMGTGASAKQHSSVTIGAGSTSDGVRNITIGPKASASGVDSIAIGNGGVGGDKNNTGVGGNGNTYTINVNDISTNVYYGVKSVDDGSIAFGNRANAAKGGLAIGTVSIADGGIAVGQSVLSKNGVAIGSAVSATAANAVALGTRAEASSVGAVAIGGYSATDKTKAQGNNALAIGVSAITNGNETIAIGKSANASNANAVAVGKNAKASIANSVAIGSDSTTDTNATRQANTTINGITYNFAGATSDTGMQVSVGAAGKERQIKNVAAGEVSATSTDAINGSQLFAVASQIKPQLKYVSIKSDTELDNANNDGATADKAIAIGPIAKASSKSTIAIGNTSTASNENAIAIGSNSNSSGVDSVAIGPSSVSNNVGSVAVGKDAKANGSFTVALGGGNWQSKGAQANGVGTVALGTYTRTKENTNYQTAVGFESKTDAESATAIGYKAVASGKDSVALGTGASTTGQDALTFGRNSQANGDSSLAMGLGAQANSNNTIALGYQANSSSTNSTNGVYIGYVAGKETNGVGNIGIGSNTGNKIIGDNNVSIGTGAGSVTSTNVYASESIMLGTQARAINSTSTSPINNVIAIGKGSSGGANSTIAIGQNASSTNQNSIAIGTNASAPAYNGVAIGSFSVANTEGGTIEGYNANASRTDKYAGLTGAVLKGNIGAVSIGSGGTMTRQIKNLAAGTADTDAVNVAQLKSVNLAFKGNTGTGDVNLAANPLTIKGNDSYITTNASGNTITISANQKDIHVISGTANADTGVANAKNVATAINDAISQNKYKWYLTADNDTAGSRATIDKEGTVKFSGDPNITVARSGNTITSSLNKVITVDTVKASKSVIAGSGNDQITLDGTSGTVKGKTFSGQSFVAGNNVLSNTTLQIGSATNGDNNVTISRDGFSSKAGTKTAKFGATGIDAGGQVIANVSSGGNVGTNAANITDVNNAVSGVKLTLDSNSKTGTVKLSDGSLKIVGANGIRTDLNGTNNDNLIIGLDKNTINATTNGIGLSGDSGTMLRKFLKDGHADFKISGDGGLVTTSGTTTGVQVSVDKSKVKDLAVEAVTVSKANNISDNPITVTSKAGTNSMDYAIGIDTTKLAAKTNLAYTSNGGTAKTVSLAKGLNFVDGGSTVATVDNDGKVSFDLNTATKNQINTNTSDIATNKGKITTNTTNIAANTTALARNISLGADSGTISSQSLSTAAVAFNVKGASGDFISTKMNGNNVEVSTKRAQIDSDVNNGVASVTGNDGLATAQNVADAINNAVTKSAYEWKLSANGEANPTTVGKGDIVDFTGGSNITVERDNKNISVKLNKNLTNLSSVSIGNSRGETIKLDGSNGGITADHADLKDNTGAGTSIDSSGIRINNGIADLTQIGMGIISLDNGSGGNTMVTTSGVTLTDGTNMSEYNAKGIAFGDTTGTNTAQFGLEGISAANQQIKDVAAGTDDTDAVNVKQLNDTVGAQKLSISDGTKDSTVALKNQKLTITGTGAAKATVNGQTITIDVAEGTLTPNTTDGTVTGTTGVAKATEVAAAINNTNTVLGDKIAANTANIAHTIALADDNGSSTTAKSLKDGNISFAVTGDGNLVSTSATATGVEVAVDTAKVKDLAVAAVTVSKDGQADNPITVTPTTGTNSKDYAIGIDTTKLAAKTDLTYRANSAADANAKKVSLSKGLDFVDGGSTVATVDNDGKVSFDLNTATKNQINTNTADIATNKGKIASNTTNIAANTTALARHISLGADTGTASSQSLSTADVAFNVKGATGDFVSTNMNGNTVEISTKRATINSNATTGEASVTGNDGLATAQNVADAINKAADAAKAGAAWNITTNSSTTDKTAVKGGDTVDLVNGDNIEITQDGTDKKKITVATKKDITVDSVTANNKVTVGSGANKITLDGTDGSVTGKAFTGTTFTGTSFTAGNTVINTNGLTNGTTSITGTGVTTDNVTVGGISIDKTAGINAGNKVISNVASGGTTLTNAANIGDVQNAVANLSQNLNITDGTNNGTVDLKNQKLNVAGANGVTAKVNNQTITVGLDADTVNATTKGIGLTADTGSTGNKYLKDGDVSFAVTGDGSLVSTSATSAGVKVAVNSASITAGTDGTITGPTTDGVATAKNVADAINAAKKASKTEITANTGEAANATTGNVTLTSTTAADGHTIYDVKLNDKVTLGSGTNAVTIDGTTGAITGKTANIGGVTVNGTANTIGGLSNTTWNGTAVSGRAATEDQLKAATGATTLKVTGDVATNTGSVNLKDDTFGIKGDGKYISTDVNGKNVNLTVSEAEVKKSAVAAVTVSTDTTDANNPLTVTPTTSADGTTKDYKVTIDGTKIANKTNLSYKANNGTAKQVSLADGLDFTNGTLTTASIDNNGVVKYDVNTAAITAGADGTITGPTTDGVATAKNVADAINAAKKASKTEITANTGEAANATTGNVTLTSTTVADGHTIYDVKLNDKVTLGSGTNAVTIDGTTGAITGKTANIGGVTVNGTANTIGGLSNTTWNGTATTGRAATEDQLKAVADAAGSQTWNITADKAGTTGNQTGTKKNATVGKDETVELVAGDNLTINQNERKFTYSLNKDLANLTSVSVGTGTTETIKLDGATGKITAKNASIGGVTIDGDNNHVTGLSNITWNGTATTGRAATEDQLKAVADTAKTTTDAVNLKFSGDTNTSPGVVNLKDDTLGIIGDGKYVSTDANGKNLTVKVSEAEVKKSAVAAVTVSTDTTDANNPLTVTPNASADGTTKDYKVTIDGTKIANKTNLSYKANDGTAKQVSLADGLNFKNGTLTTASIDDNGDVKYDVNTASITAGADGTITGPTTDGVATAKNVADAINTAKKASKTEITANTGEAANTTTGNVTLTSTTAADGHTIYDVKLNDKVTLGSGTNAVTIDGTTGAITGKIANIGGVTVNGTANTIGGLSNTTWNGTATTGRAATEDQLKAVADAAGSQTWEITADKKAGTSGAQTGLKENAKVGKDDKVSLIAGENLTVDQAGKNFTYSLNTDLVKMNSATFEATGGKTTVIKGDSIVQTDGANTNTSNATSNTITDGTNTSTITAGKAQIGTVGIDGVASKVTTGGTNAVVVNGADGTVKTGNVTVTGGTTNDITGLSNTTLSATDFATKGRAATEEQLKAATGATTLKFTGDVATNTGSVNLKDDTFGIKGDGKYISTDVNGKNVNLTVSEAEVKKSAVAAVTVSTDTTDANNPLTVTPNASADGTTKDYKVTIDGTKIANKTNLSYKANDGTAKQVSLADGLNFKNGTLTTASIDDNGVVKYDVNTASITAGVDGTITGPTTDGVATAQNVADAINAAKKASKTEITANTGEAANATTGNVTLTSTTAADGHTIYDVKLNDKVTLGTGTNAVTIDGTAGKVTIGSSIVDGVNNTFTTGGASPVTLNGATGTITGKTANIGGVTVNGTANTIGGLSNTTWNGTATTGRAATEDQLKAVADAAGSQTWEITADKKAGTSGAQTGTKENAKVGKDDKVSLIAGENLTVDQAGKNFTYSLNTDLVKMNSATFLGTGTNTTVITGDSITQTAGTQTNTSTAGGNTVADGTKSTETTAAGQVIKDGAKSNKSTVDNNVIDDGTGNVNTSNATSNTITDGTNTSTITAGKATIGSSIVDGVNNTFTTGGASPVTLNGATGTITGKTANIGGVTVDGTNNHVMGLANKDWTPGVTQAVSGRAATEDQLQKVSDAVGAGWKVNTGKVTGSTGESNGAVSTKVASGEEVQFQAGNNLIVDQNGKTVAYSLNKALKDLESATFNGTGTNKTVINGDSITQSAGTQTNTSTAGGNTVADGTKSTETTAAGQVIKDGTKTNTSTVDENTIVDDNKSNKSTVDGNTITDGTNTTETTSSSVTVKDNAGNSTVITKDNITTGVGGNKITLDGTAGKATIGSSIVDGVNNTFTTGGTNAVKLDGVAGTIKTGNVTVTGGTTNDITGLSNTTVTSADFATKGRAATEEQLKAVGEQTWQITADKDTATSGAQTGTKKDAKVGKDDKVQLIAGENMTVNQNERDFTFTLNKDLVKMNSATFLGTGTNKTVITGDSITQTAGTQTNTSTAGGNTVADGTKSTETTAAGQVIKDGTKSNKSTVDNNVIDDGTGNVNTSNATSNTITDGTNTTEATASTLTVKDNAGNSTVITKDNVTTGVGGNKITLDGTAGKATIGSSIVDGVNNTFTTGGASPVTLNGATGTITGKTANIGGVTVDGTNNHVMGLANKDWTPGVTQAVSGRAATEDQLQKVSDAVGAGWKVNTGKVTGSTGESNGAASTKVASGEEVQFQAGNNLIIDQNGKTVAYSLNKALKDLESATFNGTGTNRTVINGDSITQTAGTQTNTSTAAVNTVADGTKSTKTTADGQVIKDGAKSNKSTVDNNVIDDGNGNVNTSNAISNTITDGTNTTEATASTLTVKDNAGNSTVITKDNITTGVGANKITLDGTAGKATIGSSIVDGVNNTFTTGGTNAVKLDGAAGTIKTGTVTVTGGTTNDITGLSNTTVTSADFATKGRAATEEQLKAIGEQTWQIMADKKVGTSGAQTGTKENAKVGKDDKVSLIAGENLTVDQAGKNFTYSLNTDLVKMNSATFEATGGKTTVIKGDSIVQTDGTKTNTATASGNTVADGTKSTETTATGQVIKDGAKSNKSTVDNNVIDDGNGNVNTSNATLNTITDGTNTSTITAGKATIGSSIVDGVNNTFTTGGASPVTLNGATGTITGTTANIGGVTVDGTNNYVMGLANKDWTPGVTQAVSGRAATEDQLQKVSDAVGAGWKVNTGKVTGSTGESNGATSTKVASGEEVQFQAGNNLIVDQNGRTVAYSLNKELKDLESATFNSTGTNKTVITGDSITQTAGTQTNTSTAGGNTVADGTKSTETTAAGQVIKDGAKSNKSTVDNNVIDDGNGNVNTSNATSNTVTDGTNITEATASTLTVKDNAGNSTVITKDNITTGVGGNKITLDGTAGKATIGSSIVDGVNNTFTTGGTNAVKLDGAAGTIKTGAVTVTGGTTNDITGLSNTTVTATDFATKGRAATEEQLKAVGEQTWQITADKKNGTSGAQTGLKENAKVGKDDKVSLIAGENLTVDQAGKNFTYSLNTDLVKMNSATFEATGGKTTVIKGDSIVQTDGTKTNTATAAGNTVADGTKSTETTAAGQVIKDGAKTNTSTVDENTLVDGAKSNKTTVDSNVIDDGNGNVNTSNATSNTITDGTNTSTITAGKATIGSSIVDGVNNTFTTGGASPVTLNGATGTITGKTANIGGVTVDGTNNHVMGLANKDWTPGVTQAVSGRAATEDQLQKVSDAVGAGWKVNTGKVTGSTGESNGAASTKVASGEEVQFQAGNNLIVDQSGKTVAYSLNKALKDLESATFNGTGTNRTVITGDYIIQTTGTQTNTSTAAGNTIANGTKSTETTADSQVIKDGAKSNKSTVDSNVIDDGNGNKNTSTATSNTITDGTNTSNITAGKATIGSSIIDGVNNTFTTGGANAVTLDGATGTITGTIANIGGVTVNGTAKTVNGLSNTTWNGTAVSGRAATEDQLKAVGEQTWQITADKKTGTSGAQTGLKENAKVGKDDKVSLIAGENLTVDQAGKNFTYSLNTDLVKMNSATFEATGGKTTVIKGDSIVQTDGTKTNTATAAGNTVANGTKSTETTAAGQVIKDGAKSNKSTVDSNVIDDGNGNKNTSNATSNTITDGTNTSTITAGKANIGNIAVDGVNNKITMGNGATPVTLDGANGHLDGLTNTRWVPGVTKATTGRAATEDQLQQVSDAVGAGWKVNTGTVAGSSGVSNGAASTKVSSGEEVKLQAGDNLVIDQNGKTVSYSLNKDLTKMNSATFEATGGKTTVIKGDSIVQTDGGKTNTSNAAGNTVADGTKSTATTAAGTTITDGAKTNTSTADKNVINDGVGNTNISTATSNTLKNASGDETKADAKGVTVKDAAGNNATFTKDGITITKTGKDAVSLTSNGLDNGKNKIVNVAAGVVNTDAVNVGQLKEYAAKSTTELTANNGEAAGSTTGNIVLTKTTAADGHTIYNNKLNDKITLGTDPTKAVTVDGTTGTVTGLTNKTWTPGSIVSGRAATEDQLKSAVADSGWKVTVDSVDSGKSTVVGTSPEKIKAEETVTFKAGNNMMVTQTGKSISYAVNPELTNMTSATFTDTATGNTTVMNSNGITITPSGANPTNTHAGPVSLTKDGLNNGNNPIKGVAPGTDPTDAVNVSQLNASNANTSQAINQLAGEVQRVGAHAAAMAALKPIQYDPLEPTQVMAGVGNYRGETAAALGLAHYTNENTMFNVGVSVGGNHNMVNAGVTHKFGYSPEKKNIPDRYKAGPISSVYVMQDEVSSLKKENAEQKYVIADQAARLTTLEAENEQQRRELEETKKGLDDLKAAVDKLLASKG